MHSPKPLMNFAEVRGLLKQRFPMIMVDAVLELVLEQRILILKNVTGNEIQFVGHFPELAIMPGTLIVEALGQSASILFSRTTSLGLESGQDRRRHHTVRRYRDRRRDRSSSR